MVINIQLNGLQSTECSLYCYCTYFSETPDIR